MAADPLSTAEARLRSLEEGRHSRVHAVREIPGRADRGGGLGLPTYSEWCFSLGLLQAILYPLLPPPPVRMLDVGCGVGRVWLAAKRLLTDRDHYLGIDVNERFIAICRNLHTEPNAEFLLLRVANTHYAPAAPVARAPWPLADGSRNLITAHSVWTHLKEEDWLFYLAEAARVLAPGGRAVLTFFLLDEHYRPAEKTAAISRYYPQPENRWIFDTPAYGASDWLCPSWAAVPEAAIATPKAVLERSLGGLGLRLEAHHPGQWKEYPGLHFQDVIVLSKPH